MMLVENKGSVRAEQDFMRGQKEREIARALGKIGYFRGPITCNAPTWNRLTLERVPASLPYVAILRRKYTLIIWQPCGALRCSNMAGCC